MIDRRTFINRTLQGAVAAMLAGGLSWPARAGGAKPNIIFILADDLATDPAERHDRAAEMPALVAKAETLMQEARVDDPNWGIGKDRAKGSAKSN